MSQPFEQEQPVPSMVEVDPQHLASIIFLSYRFSQGGIGTQNRMLLYLEENFYPDIMVGDRADEVKALTHRIVGKYFLNQQLHPATAIPWEDDSPEALVKTDQIVTNEIDGLFGRFKDRQEIAAFDSDIAGIAQSVIVMDADYLARPGGRGGDSEKLKITVDPFARDPYDSWYVKYAVLGNSTNTREYDAIFSQLADEEVVRQFDIFTLKQLQFVLGTYVQNHDIEPQETRLTNLQQLITERINA